LLQNDALSFMLRQCFALFFVTLISFDILRAHEYMLPLFKELESKNLLNDLPDTLSDYTESGIQMFVNSTDLEATIVADNLAAEIFEIMFKD
jgi:hypothetical protein